MNLNSNIPTATAERVPMPESDEDDDDKLDPPPVLRSLDKKYASPFNLDISPNRPPTTPRSPSSSYERARKQRRELFYSVGRLSEKRRSFATGGSPGLTSLGSPDGRRVIHKTTPLRKKLNFSPQKPINQDLSNAHSNLKKSRLSSHDEDDFFEEISLPRSSSHSAEQPNGTRINAQRTRRSPEDSFDATPDTSVHHEDNDDDLTPQPDYANDNGLEQEDVLLGHDEDRENQFYSNSVEHNDNEDEDHAFHPDPYAYNNQAQVQLTPPLVSNSPRVQAKWDVAEWVKLEELTRPFLHDVCQDLEKLPVLPDHIYKEFSMFSYMEVRRRALALARQKQSVGGL